MLSGERVWVVSVRENQHFDIHSVSQQHVCSTHGGLYACGITVIQEHDIACQTMEHVYLKFRERCARVSNDILYAALMHGDNISIALDHEDAVFLGNGPTRLEYAIQLAVFMVYWRLRRIDIFLLHAFCGLIKFSSTESDHLATLAYPGEYSPAIESVNE